MAARGPRSRLTDSHYRPQILVLHSEHEVPQYWPPDDVLSTDSFAPVQETTHRIPISRTQPTR
jgi:hypothetical protein